LKNNQNIFQTKKQAQESEAVGFVGFNRLKASFRYAPFAF